MGIVLEDWTAQWLVQNHGWFGLALKSAPFVSADLAHDEWMLPMMMIVRRHALLDRDAARRFCWWRVAVCVKLTTFLNRVLHSSNVC